MSEMKLSEFRERVLQVTPLPEFATIERRGRARRRRRAVGAAAVVAACVVLGFGVAAVGGRDSGDRTQPVDRPGQTESSGPKILDIGMPGTLRPGGYALDNLDPDEIADATVSLIGEGWEALSSGAVQNTDDGVSLGGWGVNVFASVPVDPCRPLGPQRPAPPTASAVAEQLANVDGSTVTSSPAQVTRFGRSGTHMKLHVSKTACMKRRQADEGFQFAWYVNRTLDAIGPPEPGATVDLWVLEDGDRLLVVGKAVTEQATPSDREQINATIETLRLAPRN